MELRIQPEQVLDGTSLKSIGVRPIGFSPIWFSSFAFGYIVLHKITVYENEKINRHQTVSLQGSDQRLFPTTIIKERDLFSIVMPVPELQV